MLRASARQTGRSVDLAAIVDVGRDSKLAFGAELLAFTDAAVLRDELEMPIARRHLYEVAGSAAVVRAAACAGNFEMMNRLLDATGAPVGPAGVSLAAELGLTVPDHLLDSA